MTNVRPHLLNRWASDLTAAAHAGHLDNGRPLALHELQLINGPRAGALLVAAGVQSGRLLRVLTANDCALARQFIPWDFIGEPHCFMSGRYVRVEAGWPSAMAERDIPLQSLNQRPCGQGRWVVGRSEIGSTIVAGFNDSTPSWLVAGTSGSGKSVTVQSIIAQLAMAGDTQLVLVDGKSGESLAALRHVRGLVGPLATDVPEARSALAWAVSEMQRRYLGQAPRVRLVVVVDEFQELVSDPLIAECLRRLAAQGRAACIHLLMATQHPTVEAFGDASVKRNLAGRIVLHVTDADASRAAVGATTPRADRLLDRGDGYAVSPGHMHRVQVAYVPGSALTRLPAGPTLLPAWPTDLPAGIENSQAAPAFLPGEVGASLVAAQNEWGRPRLLNLLTDLGQQRPGSERAARLLAFGRDLKGWLDQQGYSLAQISACLPAPEDAHL